MTETRRCIIALEDLTGTKYIDSLVATNPASGDVKGEGDDHLRGIKNVIANTFPNITGAITSTQAELNKLDGLTAVLADLELLSGLAAYGLSTTELQYLNGVTSAIQTQITNALARANHTGTQTMSTISDAGTLATLNSVNAATIDANSVGNSELAADAAGHNEVNWSFNAEGSWVLTGAGSTQVIPEGIFVCTNVNGSAGDGATVEIYSGSVWRQPNSADRDAWYGGTLISDGTNVRLRRNAGASSITVYYRRLA